MKAELKFNLDEIDDKMAHLRATKSLDLALVLWELTHNSKKELERKLEATDEKSLSNVSSLDTLDLVFERIHELLEEHNIKIEELVY